MENLTGFSWNKKIQIQHLLKLNGLAKLAKCAFFTIQIQHLLKLNKCIKSATNRKRTIQIQHLLKLNKEKLEAKGLSEDDSNTTLVKVKLPKSVNGSLIYLIQIQHLLKLNRYRNSNRKIRS